MFFVWCNLQDACLGFPDSSTGKESTCNAGDLGSIPRLGRSPGEWNPLRCSGLENFMVCIVHGVATSQTWLSGFYLDLPCSSEGKESAFNAGDPGSIPELGRSPGEGNGNSLQHSCLENPIDRGAWQAKSVVSHRVRHDWVTNATTWRLYF